MGIPSKEPPPIIQGNDAGVCAEQHTPAGSSMGGLKMTGLRRASRGIVGRIQFIHWSPVCAGDDERVCAVR
jgi:hypothetical protein